MSERLWETLAQARKQSGAPALAAIAANAGDEPNEAVERAVAEAYKQMFWPATPEDPERVPQVLNSLQRLAIRRDDWIWWRGFPIRLSSCR